VADSGLKKVLKFSCLGCLGVIFLLVATVAIFGWIRGSNAEFTETGASYSPERVAATDPLAEADTTRSADLPEALGTPVNRVKLVVNGVENVVVRPCGEGEGLVVEATYDKNRVTFSELLDEEPDGSWTYTITMTGTGSGLSRFIEQLFSGREASLDVCLPTDAPIALDVEMDRAGLEAELGGLWLPTVDIQLDMGGVVVGFNAPLREPAKSVSIEVSMGGIVLQKLGNASPAVLDVNYRFAGGLFDMTGDWKQDAQIELDGTAGGVTVILPKSVRIEGVPDLAPVAGADSETMPTLLFVPGTNFKDITVRRR
jgi:hypothetical protein